jgi:dihydroorotase
VNPAAAGPAGEPPVCDLLIRADRLVCPATGLDGPGAVAIRGQRIVAAGPDVTGPAVQSLDFPAGILLPGLIDLHVHAGQPPWKYGVDPAVPMLARGTTTALSQGDAGADNWRAYVERVIVPSPVRLRMAINLARQGETAPGGCLADAAQIDVPACEQAVREAGEHVWGIAVNLSPFSCGPTDPRMVFAAALEVAGRTGKPLLFGPRRGIDDFDLADQLPLLRPGDVVTYCYHGMRQSIVADGRVRDCAWRARERGVLFDVGHGAGSFHFSVAEAAIGQGFPPDAISTDVQAGHVGQVPPHDLPRVLSKLIAIGMTEIDALARVTARPAGILGLSPRIGRLAAGAVADMAVLRFNDKAAPLLDTAGVSRPGGSYEVLLVIRAGRVIKW